MTSDSPTSDLGGRTRQPRLAALGRAAALGLAFTATLTALALPIGVGYVAYERWIAGHSLQEASLHLEDALMFLQSAASLLALAGAVAWVTLFLRRVDRQGDLRTVGLARRPRGWLQFGIAFTGGVLFAAIPIGLALALGELSFDASHWSLEGGSDVVVDALGTMIIITGMAAAEELVFRGYMPWTLGRSGWSDELSTLLPALLFAVYRIVLNPASWAVFLNAIAGGALLGLLTRLTRSLHVAIGARLGWAIVVGTVFSLPVGGAPMEGILHSLSTPRLAWGNACGPEGSWVILPLLATGVAVAQVVSFLRRRT